LAVSLVNFLLYFVLVAKYTLFYFGIYCFALIPTKFIPINISCYDTRAIFILVNFSLILEEGK